MFLSRAFLSRAFLSRMGAVATSAAIATALAPTPATGVTVDPTATGPAASSSSEDVVRLKVADNPAQRVPVKEGIWPSTLLRQHGVQPDANDIVLVKREGREKRGTKRRLRDGDIVKVVDVTRNTRVKRVKVAPRTVTVHTTKLKPGRRKVVAQGRPAVHRVEIRRTLHNDEVVQKKVVDREVVRKQRPRRVLVGRQPYSVPGADGLNWAALARCESGGNPRAVNPAGYFGLYQFNLATWRSVGGSGMPHHASAAQQTYRAKLLYKARGRSPWPHCGRYL